MLSNELKNEAVSVWLEYGEAINKAFGFKGLIEAGPLLNALKTEDPTAVKKFIECIKSNTKQVQEAKWIGED